MPNRPAAVASADATPARARPPSYLSRSTLAAELDVSESTVDEMVRRGVLPRPLRLSSGCVRWSWAAVEQALASLGGTVSDQPSDPYLQGARNAAQATGGQGGR